MRKLTPMDIQTTPVVDCQATGNPKTGQADARCGKKVGDDLVNASAGVFASKPGTGGVVNPKKPVNEGPVTKGMYAAVNANGHGLSIERGHIKGFGSTTTVTGQVNLHQSKADSHQSQGSSLKSQSSSLNATGFYSHTRTHDLIGGGLNLQTPGNHQASFEVSRVPKFDVTTMQASGRANLYTSPSGNLNLNATGNVNHHLSGPRRGKSDFGTGLNLRYDF